jgi:hypothetical protein
MTENLTIKNWLWPQVRIRLTFATIIYNHITESKYQTQCKWDWMDSPLYSGVKCYMGHHTTTLWEQKSDRNAQQYKAPFLLYLTEGVFWLRKIYLKDTALSTILVLSQVSFCCKEFWQELWMKYRWYCPPISIQNKTAFFM